MNRLLRFIKHGNALVPENKVQTALYGDLVRNLPDNSIVEIWVSTVDPTGSLAQLARVHAMIREISNTTGQSVVEIKLEVKRLAGLVVKVPSSTTPGEWDVYTKSFADCSRDQLSGAIQACHELGELVGCVFPQ